MQGPEPQLPVIQLPTTQNMETSLAPHFVLPLAPVNSKYEELSSSEMDKTKLAKIPAVLRKYSALHTECMIGQLCVKLACEALFGDAVLKRCIPTESDFPGLAQVELALPNAFSWDNVHNS